MPLQRLRIACGRGALRIPDALREINCWWVCPVPTPGFSTVLERSGRGLSGGIVGIIVRCGPVGYSCGTFGAPRLASFWAEYSAPKRADMGGLGTLEAREGIAIMEEVV